MFQQFSKTNASKITIILAIVFTFFGGLAAKAQNRDFFFVQADQKVNSLTFTWKYDNSKNTAEKFTIFMAKGIQKEFANDGFEKIVELSSEDIKPEKEGYYFFQLPFNAPLPEQYYSFVLQITETDDNLITSNSFIIELRRDDPIYDKLYFSTIPEPEASVNTLYTSTVQAEYVSDSSETPKTIYYKLEKAPEGMEIDKESGEITWTPTESGIYHGSVVAYLADNPKVAAHFFFEIYVRKCSTPIEVTGKITDKNDIPISIGYLTLFPTDKESQKPNENNMPQAMVIDGEFTLLADEGEYYMVLYDEYGNNYIYENATIFEDATKINLTCGQNITLNWKVESMSFQQYLVSGKVVDENDKALPNTVVYFQSIYEDSEVTRSDKMYGKAITDENGEYEVYLLDSYKYIAFLDLNQIPDNPNQKFNINNILYYNQTFKYDEASILELTADLSDINFKVMPNPDYTYFTASGYVKDSSNNPIENAVIFFEGFNSNEEFGHFHYYDQTYTDENGYYEIKLLDAFSYIAYAMVKGDKENNWDRNMMPLFYNQTYNRDDATIIKKDPNSDKVTDINFTFNKIEDEYYGYIFGTVMNTENEPLPNVFVEAIRVGNTEINHKDRFIYGFTDELGIFTIKNLPDGEYALFASSVNDTSFACGYYVANAVSTINFDEASTITIAPDIANIEVSFILQSISQKEGEGIVKGKILDLENYNSEKVEDAAINTARVYLENNNILANFEESNADGSFMITNLVAGGYNITIEKPGYNPYTTFVEVGKDIVDLGEILLTTSSLGAVTDITSENNFAYPNPTSDVINVAINFEESNVPVNLTIYDIYGNQVYVQNGLANGSVLINTKSFANGVYLVKLTNGISETAQNIIISK